MAAGRKGFRRNSKTIRHILRNVDGGKQAAAEAVLGRVDDDEAFLSTYYTDRQVIGVVVPADKQAKDGIATKAASDVGLTQGAP